MCTAPCIDTSTAWQIWRLDSHAPPFLSQVRFSCRGRSLRCFSRCTRCEVLRPLLWLLMQTGFRVSVTSLAPPRLGVPGLCPLVSVLRISSGEFGGGKHGSRVSVLGPRPDWKVVR